MKWPLSLPSSFGLLIVVTVGLRLVTAPASREETVDAAMVQAGKELFVHRWKPNDPLAKGGDGLGPVFNADSCVACHKQGGTGGSGPREANVNTFTVRNQNSGVGARQGVVHTRAISPEFQETFAHVHPGLPANVQAISTTSFSPGAAELTGWDISNVAFPAGVHLSQRKTPALFGAKLIDETPDRVILANERAQQLKWGFASPLETTAPVGRALRLADGRVGRFGWKAQTASLADFVQAACANELGLGNPGQAQPQPLGRPGYKAPGFDLTLEQCSQLTAFVKSLPQPVERLPQSPETVAAVQAGRKHFSAVGCADCHTPDLEGIKGIYSDLLLHWMGESLEGDGDYNDEPVESPQFASGAGPHPAEWRTPPLWGVASSAPYLHDGRAATLAEAIRLHDGQGADSARRFARLSAAEQQQLITFLETLQAP